MAVLKDLTLGKDADGNYVGKDAAGNNVVKELIVTGCIGDDILLCSGTCIIKIPDGGIAI